MVVKTVRFTFQKVTMIVSDEQILIQKFNLAAKYAWWTNMKMVVGTTRYAFPTVRIIKFDDSPNEITSISPALFYHAWHTCFFPQTLVLHHLLIVVFTQNPPALNER